MKTRLFVLLLVPLWLWPAFVIADEARWAHYMRAGADTYERGDYEEAVGKTKAALKEAEDFGEQDPRFTTTLNSLAIIYRALGRYAEAEPLYDHGRSYCTGSGRSRPTVALIVESSASV